MSKWIEWGGVHRLSAEVALQGKTRLVQYSERKRLRAEFVNVRVRDHADTVVEVGEASVRAVKNLDVAVHAVRLPEKVLIKQAHAIWLEESVREETSVATFKFSKRIRLAKDEGLQEERAELRSEMIKFSGHVRVGVIV